MKYSSYGRNRVTLPNVWTPVVIDPPLPMFSTAPAVHPRRLIMPDNIPETIAHLRGVIIVIQSLTVNVLLPLFPRGSMSGTNVRNMINAHTIPNSPPSIPGTITLTITDTDAVPVLLHVELEMPGPTVGPVFVSSPRKGLHI